MDASTTRAAAFAAGAVLLAEALWLARPARILPVLEAGLGGPPPLGRPAPGDGASAAFAPPAASAAADARGEDEDDPGEELRDALAAESAPAARARLGGGRTDADADATAGPTRRAALFLGSAPGASAPARSARGVEAGPHAAAAARAAAAAAARLAAENAARARRHPLESADARRRADEQRAELESREKTERAAAARGRETPAREASRRAEARGGAGRAASLFEPTERGERAPTSDERAERPRRRRERERERRGARRGENADARRARVPSRRFKPLLLGGALGAKPLRPPAAGLEPPAALLDLPARRPPTDADGKPTPESAAGLAAVEELDPRSLAKDRRAGAHWDGDEWHDGAARGVARDGSWLWTYRRGAQWWALAGEPPAPLLRHDGAWWLKGDDGMWFVVHDGAPWALRHFNDWDAQGLFHPASGTQIVYSSDYARVAVITPGRGAEVFDAKTGVLIGTIPEDRMPPTRRPKPPPSLPTPPAR